MPRVCRCRDLVGALCGGSLAQTKGTIDAALPGCGPRIANSFDVPEGRVRTGLQCRVVWPECRTGWLFAENRPHDEIEQHTNTLQEAGTPVFCPHRSGKHVGKVTGHCVISAYSERGSPCRPRLHMRVLRVSGDDVHCIVSCAPQFRRYSSSRSQHRILSPHSPPRRP